MRRVCAIATEESHSRRCVERGDLGSAVEGAAVKVPLLGRGERISVHGFSQAAGRTASRVRLTDVLTSCSAKVRYFLPLHFRHAPCDRRVFDCGCGGTYLEYFCCTSELPSEGSKGTEIHDETPGPLSPFSGIPEEIRRVCRAGRVFFVVRAGARKGSLFGEKARDRS